VTPSSPCEHLAVQPNVLPINCIQLRNTSDSSARKLNIAVNAGGQVRMCDPAVSDTNDPRVCQGACN
jgi:hypothetical protein